MLLEQSAMPKRLKTQGAVTIEVQRAEHYATADACHAFLQRILREEPV